MEGQTMGYDFVKLNPDISYHLAFTYIHMPWIKKRKIEKAQMNKHLKELGFFPSYPDASGLP
jgi:erythromycin esterase